MMKAQFTTFGEIDIAGQRYDHDVVIDGGKIRSPLPPSGCSTSCFPVS